MFVTAKAFTCQTHSNNRPHRHHQNHRLTRGRQVEAPWAACLHRLDGYCHTRLVGYIYALSQATDTTASKGPHQQRSMPSPPRAARAAVAAGGSRRRLFGDVATILLGTLLLVLQVLPPGVTAAAPLKGPQPYAIATLHPHPFVSILHITHHHRSQSRPSTRRSWTSLRPQDSRRRSTRRRVCAFVCVGTACVHACMYMYKSSRIKWDCSIKIFPRKR